MKGELLNATQSPVPLTPSLSPREREDHPPSGDESAGSGLSQNCEQLLPLPSGEGRGEGNLGAGPVQKAAPYAEAQAPKRGVNEIARLLAPPQFLLGFGRAGTGPGEFNRPEGLCVDAQDRVYVADSCNHRIQIFSGDGKFLRAYGKAGTGKGELSYPYDICVDAAGRQYVCEFGNSRIQVFDAQDRPIEIIGGPGAEPGWFSNPWGVALDSAGDLYVADSQNHRVQKLIRSPKAETRRSKEGRNPKSETRNGLLTRVASEFESRPSFGFRVSEFGLLSTFDLRTSDFVLPASLFVHQ